MSNESNAVLPDCKSNYVLNIDIGNYRHVSFDLWLTLIRSHPEFKSNRTLLFHRFFETKNLEQTATAIRKLDVLSNENCEKFGVHIHAETIYKLIFEELKMDYSEISQTDFDNFNAASEALFINYPPTLIFPQIGNFFEELKSTEKTLSILSNTAFIKGTSLRGLMEFYNLGRYFSFQLYSDETGYSKPNPKMFEEVIIQKQKTAPEILKREILHVGDNANADYNGALNYGFGAHLLQ